MRDQDHSTYQEWLDLALEGQLAPAETRALAAHLADCAECRAGRDQLLGLHRLFQAGQVPLRGDFRRQVLAALPTAAWQARPGRAWRWPVAVLLALGLATAVLMGGNAARLQPGAPFVAALAAVAELFVTSALAGAGLLYASWKGVGIVIGEFVARSLLNLAALAILALAGNWLLVRLLRRRPIAATAAARSERSPD